MASAFPDYIPTSADAKVGRADVSVIMPAYQAAATLERALRSIANQTVKPREVLVVDDGSADGSYERALACAPLMQGVALRVFRQANSGPGAARNRALAEARGRWIAFLDADDEWLPRKLERSLAVMAEKGVTMVAHDIFEISTAGEKTVDCRSRWLTNPADPFRTLFLRGFISSSTVVVPREVLCAVGGFDSGLRSAQDYELWLAVLARIGASFELFAEPLLRYYLFEGGITSNVGLRRACNLRILRRHAANLRALPGPALRPFLERLAIIHLEAFRGHRARGNLRAAAATVLRFPAVVLAELARLPFAGGERPNFLSHLPAVLEQAEPTLAPGGANA